MRRRIVVVTTGVIVGTFALLAGCAKGTTCGNGMKDGKDECDGVDLGGASCASLGLGTGTLKCTDRCTFDTSSCSANAVCGNGVREGTEACDGLDLGGQTCATLQLGSGQLQCNLNCTFDTSGCSRQAECGNGIVEGGEQCDGNNLGGKTCASIGMGFSGGTLACNPDCTWNTTGCTQQEQCGNGVIEAGEQCDGNNFAGATCQTFGFTGGALRCTPQCQVDTNGCSSTAAENCTNGQDDDRDGQTDCSDQDCLSNPACGGQPEQCTNGVDDDRDGQTDCSDVDCSSDPACSGSNEEVCDNGTDDDGNFLCDCQDIFSCWADCLFYPSSETNCSDGQDEDHDCFVDCNDSDCDNDPACGGQPEVCDNGADDDGDGDTDCDDSDCDGDPACPVCVADETATCGDQFRGNTAAATSHFARYPDCSDFDYSGPDVVVVFSRDTDGDATVILEPDSKDLDLIAAPASGSDCDLSQCVAHTNGGASAETRGMHARAGEKYYIIVDGWNGNSDTFTLRFECQ